MSNNIVGLQFQGMSQKFDALLWLALHAAEFCEIAINNVIACPFVDKLFIN